MYLQTLAVSEFRNIRSIELSLGSGFNYIHGANGAGKTALLESIHLLARGRSFRTGKGGALIRRAADELVVRGVVESAEGDRVTLAVAKSRSGQTQLRIDSRRETRVSALARLLPVQTLLPDAGQLVLGGPAERRGFLDWGLFHVEHSFLDVSRRFRRVLSQRNAWLKSPSGQDCGSSADDPWFGQLQQLACALSELRASYVHRLEPVFQEMRALLTPELSCRLGYDWGGLVNIESVAKKLSESLVRDVKLGVTHRGPQRGDLIFTVDDHPAAETVSRGQAKLLASAALLAQAKLLEMERGTRSVILIDDFGAELDRSHELAFGRALQELQCQVVATSTQEPAEGPDWVQNLPDCAVFHVEHGQLIATMSRT